MSQLYGFMPNVETTSRAEEGYMRIRMKLDRLSDQMKIQNEKLAFLKIKKELMKDTSMVGKFIAIHNGKVVDSDNDDILLMKRVYDSFGYIPILITQLVEETKVIIHSPRSKTY